MKKKLENILFFHLLSVSWAENANKSHRPECTCVIQIVSVTTWILKIQGYVHL